MDLKKHINLYKTEWFGEVERFSSNLFSVDEDALEASSGLKRVVTIKRLPSLIEANMIFKAYSPSCQIMRMHVMNNF